MMVSSHTSFSACVELLTIILKFLGLSLLSEIFVAYTKDLGVCFSVECFSEQIVRYPRASLRNTVKITS